MILSKRQRWLIVTGVAGSLAAHLAEHVLTSGWRLAARKDPPEDPSYEDVDWKSAVLWTAAAGAVVGLSDLLGRQIARTAWKNVTGKRPPQRKKRSRVRSRRQAVA